jgi:hypothetical protein
MIKCIKYISVIAIVGLIVCIGYIWSVNALFLATKIGFSFSLILCILGLISILFIRD